MAETPLLRVKNLKKYFPIRGGLFSREVARVHAVDDVSFDDRRGARRSGWWASRAAASRRPGRCILRLIEPTAGEVWFERQERHHAGQALAARTSAATCRSSSRIRTPR